MDPTELKIVINIKGNRAIIGVNAPDCDPVFENCEGDIAVILGNAANLIDTARAKWAKSKKNPSITIPNQAPVKETVAASTSANKAKPVPAAKSVKDTVQQAMF